MASTSKSGESSGSLRIEQVILSLGPALKFCVVGFVYLESSSIESILSGCIYPLYSPDASVQICLDLND